MRYEAKHSYFKHLARVLNNFKNISKTLASRHQHYMCYQMMNPSAYMRNQITYTGGIYYAFFFLFFFPKYSPFLIKSLVVSRITVQDLDTSVEVQFAAEELTDETEVFR